MNATLRWEIEFVPDDPQVPPAEKLSVTGNYEHAQAYAESHHPDYLCKQIVFHRRP